MNRIGSRFGPRTTAFEVVADMDLSGVMAVVTGGASGLGLETVRALRLAGAEVVIAARNSAQAHDAIIDLDRSGQGGVGWAPLDLSDPVSIDAFVSAWGRRPLDLLINNAGVMACPLARTTEGLEMQFGVNHLGHHRLTCGLAEALELGARQRRRPSRVVCLSSGGHRRAPVDFDDPNFDVRPYDPYIAYGQSKTANALFAVELDRRGDARGIQAFSVAPGSIMTALQRHLSRDELIARKAIDAEGNPQPWLKTPEQGASTSVWAAVGSELDEAGGLYLFDCAEAPPWSDATPDGVMPYARDRGLASRLWNLSETITGATM